MVTYFNILIKNKFWFINFKAFCFFSFQQEISELSPSETKMTQNESQDTKPNEEKTQIYTHATEFSHIYVRLFLTLHMKNVLNFRRVRIFFLFSENLNSFESRLLSSYERFSSRLIFPLVRFPWEKNSSSRKKIEEK